MAKYKIYAAALDEAVLQEESDNKEDLVLMFESFEQTHDVVTATLIDDSGKNLNEDLVRSNHHNRVDF